MWAKVKADQVIEVFNGAKAITDNHGVQHPSSIFSHWSKSELADIGIYPVTQADAIDNRFYRQSDSSYSYKDGVVTETLSSSAKEIADLISQYKIDIDKQAYHLLQSSDWMAVRQYETGVSMSDDWKTYRAGVRTKATEMKTAVSAVTSVGALKDLHIVYTNVTAKDNTVSTTIASGVLYNFGEVPTE